MWYLIPPCYFKGKSSAPNSTTHTRAQSRNCRVKILQRDIIHDCISSNERMHVVTVVPLNHLRSLLKRSQTHMTVYTVVRNSKNSFIITPKHTQARHNQLICLPTSTQGGDSARGTEKVHPIPVYRLCITKPQNVRFNSSFSYLVMRSSHSCKE